MNKKKLKDLELTLKEISLEKEKKTISEDTTIIIKSNKEYSLKIIENTQLTLIFEKDGYSKIKITIEKNKKLELIEFISNKEAKYKREINQKENSTVKIAQIIFNNKYISTTSKIGENSIYQLKTAYFNSNCESIIINSSTQIEKNSKSHLEIQGAAKEHSIINNDGIITITPKGNNCSGHQKIKNILLDNTCKINSEPILEIQNHNVTCSHGATTSKIEDEIISYIESRGLTQKQATKMIIEGFFYKSIQSLQKENSKINEKIEKKLKNELKIK